MVEGDGLRAARDRVAKLDARGRRAGKSGEGPVFGDVPPHEVGQPKPSWLQSAVWGDLRFEFNPVTGDVKVTSTSGVLQVEPVSPGVARLSSRRREGVPGVVS